MSSEENPTMFTGYFPIWGCTFDSDGAGLVGGRVMAYIPYPDEWRQVQKSDVWRERFVNNPGSLDGPEPPVCLVVGEVLQEDEDSAAGFHRLSATMIEQAQDAVLVLRLLKSGWFLDPELSERIFSHGFFNQRLVGPYRQAFLGGIPQGILPRYQLGIDKLATKKDQVTITTRMWQLIENYRGGRAHRADIAIGNFNRSYGYQLMSTQRAAFLFTALDAMLGGMSAKRIGEVTFQSRFRNRVVAALNLAVETIEGVKPNEEAEWLDSKGRQIRNALAHGRPNTVAEEAEKSYDRLQSIVRVLLRQYIEFSIKWGLRSGEIGQRLGLPVNCPPAAAYNKVLDSHAIEVIDGSELLRFDISAF
jgi:hypothetical protein